MKTPENILCRHLFCSENQITAWLRDNEDIKIKLSTVIEVMQDYATQKESTPPDAGEGKAKSQSKPVRDTVPPLTPPSPQKQDNRPTIRITEYVQDRNKVNFECTQDMHDFQDWCQHNRYVRYESPVVYVQGGQGFTQQYLYEMFLYERSIKS